MIVQLAKPAPFAVVRVHETGPRGYGPSLTRAFDLLTASVMLIFSAPLFALTALAIRLEGGGPALYRQTRTGLAGRPFQMLKFRSMRCDAEPGGTPRWAEQDDPRITRVGRFIRRTRIDELPQLLNVLQGDMSMVGPRPERPAFVQAFNREIPFYAVRHTLKPGITGLAQVRYQYAGCFAETARKLEFDLYYVRNRSLALDLCILLETVAVVLTGRGAR